MENKGLKFSTLMSFWTSKLLVSTRPWPFVVQLLNNPLKELQRRLNKKGAKLAVDSSFGPLTLRTVSGFQRNHGLVPDGIVGTKTQAVLNRICR